MKRKKLLSLLILFGPFLLANSPAPSPEYTYSEYFSINKEDYEINDEGIFSFNFNNNTEYFLDNFIIEHDGHGIGYSADNIVLPPYSYGNIEIIQYNEAIKIVGDLNVYVTGYKLCTTCEYSNFNISDLTYNEDREETSLIASMDIVNNENVALYGPVCVYYDSVNNTYYSGDSGRIINKNSTKNLYTTVYFDTIIDEPIGNIELDVYFGYANDYYNNPDFVNYWPLYLIPIGLVAFVVITIIVTVSMTIYFFVKRPKKENK